MEVGYMGGRYMGVDGGTRVRQQLFVSLRRREPKAACGKISGEIS